MNGVLIHKKGSEEEFEKNDTPILLKYWWVRKE